MWKATFLFIPETRNNTPARTDEWHNVGIQWGIKHLLHIYGVFLSLILGKINFKNVLLCFGSHLFFTNLLSLLFFPLLLSFHAYGGFLRPSPSWLISETAPSRWRPFCCFRHPLSLGSSSHTARVCVVGLAVVDWAGQILCVFLMAP